MALEQQIADLATASNALTTEVVGKMGAIDAKVAAKELEVDNYLATARDEAPFFRMSRNQVLRGIGAVPDFWSAPAGVVLTRVFTVTTGILWANRTLEEQAILTAMGLADAVYINGAFDVWRMSWTSNAPTAHALHQYIPTSVALTIGAMVKLESGAINGFWAEGAIAGQWVNTGIHYPLTNLRYANIHPMRMSAAGSMLFALPAAVTGHVPLGQNKWGKFPYIGDTYAS